MNTYRIDLFNSNTGEWLYTLEQTSARLKQDLVKYAIDRAFEEQCTEGMDAKNVHFDVYRNNELVCMFSFELKQYFSTAYTNVFIHFPGKDPVFYRQMIIAE